MRIQNKLIITVVVLLALVIVAIWGLPAYVRFIHNPVGEFDYVIFREGDMVKGKNVKTGGVDFAATNASSVFTHVLRHGNNVYIKSGEYMLEADFLMWNKKNVRIVGDRATLRCNGKKIVFLGDNFTRSQYNHLSDFEIINGTIRVENSFATTISNVVFRDCTLGLEIANTNTWSEGTKIEDCHFINCIESLVFRAPSGPSTGSYANTQIERCYFNLHRRGSTGIVVQENAGFTDSLVQNVRMWMGEFSQEDQIGISIAGSMLQTLLENVIFESFAQSPHEIYGFKLIETAEPPILGGGVTFLGNWTARINNPHGVWIYGSTCSFKRENVNITVGLNEEYGPTQIINAYSLRITSFKARIRVSGTFYNKENVTVRLRLEFIDNTVSQEVEKVFNQTDTIWLDDDDVISLAPASNIIWAILVDGKADSLSTDVKVIVDVYGTSSS